MGPPEVAVVQQASQTLLFSYSGSGTETEQDPEVLRLGDWRVKSQVRFLLILLSTLKQN